MSDQRKSPIQADDSFSNNSTHSDRLRTLLQRANLSQRAAARRLGVDERTMRMWCAGQGAPPESVFRALSFPLTHAESMRQMIQSNEEIIEAIETGRITGMGYGAGLSSPHSAASAAQQLREQNEEHRALVRLEEAIDRRREAHATVYQQWLPHGSGAPDLKDIASLDAAEEEFRAAKSEVDRITQRIRLKAALQNAHSAKAVAEITQEIERTRR